MSIKKILLCSVCVLVIATPAFARTKPVDTSSILEGPDQWTGAYIGANLGGGLGMSQSVDVNGNHAGEDVGVGVTGGIDFGYDYEYDNFVFGMETDISGSSLRVNNMCSDIANHRCGADQEWFATLRPRIGYALGNFLPYATGGLAVGNVHATRYDALANLLTNDQSDTQLGYAAGAGLQYMLTRHWSAKGEYMYTHYQNTDSPNLAGFGPAYTIPLSEHILRIGVNYTF